MGINTFNKNIRPACEYCALGHLSPNHMILCKRHGVVEKEYHCRAFIYDPLIRTPKSPQIIPKFDYNDFKID